jgi:hypothetical protein
MLFLGTAFALGLLGARFLKSSGDQSQSGAGYSGGYGSRYGSEYVGGYPSGYAGGYPSSYAASDYSAGGYRATAPDLDLHTSQEYPMDYQASGTLTQETEGVIEGTDTTYESGIEGETPETQNSPRERTWTGSSLEES